jgi:hypothetical protein
MLKKKNSRGIPSGTLLQQRYPTRGTLLRGEKNQQRYPNGYPVATEVPYLLKKKRVTLFSEVPYQRYPVE